MQSRRGFLWVASESFCSPEYDSWQSIINSASGLEKEMNKDLSLHMGSYAVVLHEMKALLF